MATMKAAQVTEKGKDFDIVEREIPEPGEGQVRVMVERFKVVLRMDQ